LAGHILPNGLEFVIIHPLFRLPYRVLFSDSLIHYTQKVTEKEYVKISIYKT